jgi:hypothetical protein
MLGKASDNGAGDAIPSAARTADKSIAFASVYCFVEHDKPP